MRDASTLYLLYRKIPSSLRESHSSRAAILTRACLIRSFYHLLGKWWTTRCRNRTCLQKILSSLHVSPSSRLVSFTRAPLFAQFSIPEQKQGLLVVEWELYIRKNLSFLQVSRARLIRSFVLSLSREKWGNTQFAASPTEEQKPHWDKTKEITN